VMKDLCAVTSDTFSVRAQATDRVSQATLRVDACLARSDKGATCISWRER
jgi:hypothetical protein